MTDDIKTKDMLLPPVTTLLMFALDIREGRAQPDLRMRCVIQLKRFAREQKDAGVFAEAIADRMFALSALLDETCLGNDIPEKAAWQACPLQQEFFKTNAAGTEFFERLDRICADPALQPGAERRIEVLETYFECLCAGFVGKYRLEGEEARSERIRFVVKLLAKLTRSDVPAPKEPSVPPAAPWPLAHKVALWALIWAVLIWALCWILVRAAWEPVLRLTGQ